MGVCKSYIEKKIMKNAKKNQQNEYLYDSKLTISIFRGTKALPNNRAFIDLCTSPNAENNLDIFKKIQEENDKLAPLMKEKIIELTKKSKNPNNPIIMIGTGNSCNNPCYFYNVSLIHKCPKCGGKVEEDFENDYAQKKQFNETYNTIDKVKVYNEGGICTDFRWNNNVDLWDVNFAELYKHFDREDNANKVHYSIKIVNKGTGKVETVKEYDMPRHYCVIDGQRFDFPYGLPMGPFLLYNNNDFFPVPKQREGATIDSAHSICFAYEGEKEDVGQSLGYYGYAWKHIVYIYSCNSCGHKYHIIKTSPFAFRDKSKDIM